MRTGLLWIQGCPLVSLLLLATLALPGTGQSASYKIRLRRDGIYQVGWEELRDAGGVPLRIPGAALSMRANGKPVPLLVEDGGDGLFGPGDRIIFIGRHPSGETSFFDPESEDNVYWLETSGRRPVRFHTAPPGRGDPVPLRIERHRERDRLLVRFRGDASDLWYERKLSFLDPSGTHIRLNLPHIDTSSRKAVRVTLALKGWSTPQLPPDTPTHQVNLSLNAREVAVARWTDSGSEIVNLDPLPPHIFHERGNDLLLRVPRRRLGSGAIVDVSLLNWVKVDYPAIPSLPAGQACYSLSGVEGDVSLESKEPLIALSPEGIVPAPRPGGFHLTSSMKRLYVATKQSLLRPRSIVAREPLHLDDPATHADYLVVVHSSLRSAIMPLVTFHRRRGLRVLVVDVEEIFDTFGDGRPHASAISAFLRYAYHCYRPPRPRFVLLVGDASWDPRGLARDDRAYANWADSQHELNATRFRAIAGSRYQAGNRDRNLIPTVSYGSHEGHSASDNSFVCVDGDDFRPDMAIGRLPVVSPEEVLAISEKTIRLMNNPPNGRWKTAIAAIADGSQSYLRQSEKIIEGIERKGFRCLRLYPQGFETIASRRKALWDTFDKGSLIVHFLGHGGRFIWRTAPADYKRQSDLFTLADVDRLAKSWKLPVVLSMTCYSAPFDHPFLDSIGERLLRTPGKGAAAFVGASWRNIPSPKMSATLMDKLTIPGMTAGEALRLAKQDIQNRDTVELYSLLGDPALVLPLPDVPISLTADSKSGAVTGSARPAGSGSSIRLDWISDFGAVVASRSIEVGGSFHADFPGTPSALASLRGVRALLRSPSGDGIAFASLRKRSPIRAGRSDQTVQAFRPKRHSTKGHTFHFTTASEQENLGFDVYRSYSASGPFERLTKTPIPGAGTSDAPHRYTVNDPDADLGRDCYYYVESISIAGKRERFTPVFRVPAARKGTPADEEEKPR